MTVRKVMESNPTAAVIIIGNEILSGRTNDQNITYLAKRLTELGIKLQQAIIIPDVTETIINTVRACQKNYTYVFTTGGIGPTHDDITADAIAKALRAPLTVHPEAKQILINYYGKEHLNESRLKMAFIPLGATLIANPVSAAPGFYLQNVYVMAGVPEIMRAMFDKIAASLQPGATIFSETVHSLLGESILAKELGLIQARYPEIDIGSYPYFKNRSFGLSLVLRGTDAAKIALALADVIALVKEKGGNPILENHQEMLGTNAG